MCLVEVSDDYLQKEYYESCMYICNDSNYKIRKARRIGRVEVHKYTILRLLECQC
jgi:putative component of membrane protein insertase Oxa1/YidC/SpoIIIJ protein YidD